MALIFSIKKKLLKKLNVKFYKIKLLINSIIFLKPIQIYFRIYYYARNRIFGNLNYDTKIFSIEKIYWKNTLNTSNSFHIENKEFIFLNIKHKFSNNINWNLKSYGKLWTYNLNYFEFLNQDDITKDIGLDLIFKYIKCDTILIEGKEPYPVSLRIINWIKFLSQNKINNDEINKFLLNDCYLLYNNLEYHLLGNHLLENAFSLLFSSYYFKNHKFYIKSRKLLFHELNEQILNDGGHFELSPMYHNIILNRLLDSIKLIEFNNQFDDNRLLNFLKDKACLMLSWLENITYNSGIFPMFNDSAKGISFEPKLLLDYAKSMGLNIKKVPLSDSGYRKVVMSNYELIIDVGNIGPDYQPGHAHSDTFNFELHLNELPVIVDTGISTYENNNVRKIERSTYSHNTVKIGDKDQTQVWGVFRVARRAKVISLKEKTNYIEAAHDGYLSDGFIHKRSFLWSKEKLIIKDKISKSTKNTAIASFHLHSSIPEPKINDNKIIIKSIGVYIKFENALNIYIDKYQLSEGFNKTKLAYVIRVDFDKSLKTKILF